LEGELADRFGPLHTAAEYLIDGISIAILARPAGIAKVDAGPAANALTPSKADHDISQCRRIFRKRRPLAFEEANRRD
jgi:transcription-repair coupling factor (superfamily II helicase)